MYKYILFDLDGTLLNTFPGVSNALRYTMEYYKMPVPSETEMRKYLGPPLGDSFRDYAGFDENEIPRAIKKFREYYLEKGVYEYEFFEELKPSFDRLRAMGCKLAVATSKLEPAAISMLTHAGIIDEFDFICGAKSDGARTTKTEVLLHVLEHFDIKDKSEVLLIGDRNHDVIGAKNVGIDCCGVLCGFGSREEFEESGAAYIVRFISDIFTFL